MCQLLSHNLTPSLPTWPSFNRWNQVLYYQLDARSIDIIAVDPIWLHPLHCHVKHSQSSKQKNVNDNNKDPPQCWDAKAHGSYQPTLDDIIIYFMHAKLSRRKYHSTPPHASRSLPCSECRECHSTTNLGYHVTSPLLIPYASVID